MNLPKDKAVTELTFTYRYYKIIISIMCLIIISLLVWNIILSNNMYILKTKSSLTINEYEKNKIINKEMINNYDNLVTNLQTINKNNQKSIDLLSTRLNVYEDWLKYTEETKNKTKGIIEGDMKQ